LQFTIAILATALILGACRNHNRKTIIATNSDNHSQKVEYTGWISFNSDKTAIESMSERAYLKYDDDNDEIKAKCDSKGNIIYELEDGTKTTALNNEQQQLLIKAIKFICSQQHILKNGNIY
ncbi:MAG: hypothetical protein ACXVJC_24505, partial [Mucilaginibacter sp.]